MAWLGAVGVGVSASGVEYFDEPGLSLLLSDMPRRHYRLFAGGAPLGPFMAHSAQVHVDPSTADAAELIEEISKRTAPAARGPTQEAATKRLIADPRVQGWARPRFHCTLRQRQSPSTGACPAH